MSDYDFDIGIIGGGAAGLTVASGAAQLGAKTLLIEKENELGGDCLHFGCVPSKTLIKTAHVYHLMKNTGKFGLPIPEISPVDYRDIVKRIRKVISEIQKHDSEERFCNLGVRVEFGEVEFLDEHLINLSGKRISAKKWIITTGSSAAIPPIKGLDKTSYMTNREIFYMDHLPASMIILGAGPIAVEMAQSFCRLGSKVKVVQRSGQILSREDEDLSHEVRAILEDEGVEFYLNTTVLETRDSKGKKEVVINDEEGKESILSAETILVAMGRKPEIESLNLANIGIETFGDGIKVDDKLRTTQKNIYAAGDVTGRYQFTHAAGYEGGIVLSNAIFHIPRKVNYTFLPWCTYTDPELASIGMNEKRAEKSGIKYSVWMEEFKDNDRSLAEGNRSGKIKMILDEKERPIGVQILGPHAGELIGEWVSVFNGNVKLTTLASAVHPYPTLVEVNKRVAGTYLSPKIFSDKVKKSLTFFFHLKGRACGFEEN